MKIVYIENQSKLEALVQQLMRLKSISLDLEFDKNRFQYGFTMCLMQIGYQDACYVIDPLSKEIDITTVFPVIASPEVEKLGFELGEDIRLFKHLGVQPQNLYDVSIATKLLDYGQVSLSNALETILGIETSKQSQKSNWMRRPLSDAQIHYAAEDVMYLASLKEEVHPRIVDNGMLEWLNQEQEALEHLNGDAPGIASYIKPRDMDDFNEVNWQVFEGLLEFREQQARRLNKPPFQVLDKEFLMQVAQHPDHIQKLHSHGKAMRSLRSEAFKTMLRNESNKLRDQATSNGASPHRPAKPKQDRETARAHRQRKKEENILVDRLLKPLQSEIKSRYGEHTASYLLSGKMMKDLAAGEHKHVLPYKKQLLQSIAKELQLDLSEIGW